jgi:Uma2 family endonuclease
MTILINDPDVEDQLLADRRAKGLDRYDEVWEGVYVMSPLANNEHQKLALRLASIMDTVIDLEMEGTSYCGCNVSDQEHDWKFNYRCPDVAVFLRDTTAQDRGAFWQGGPDFAIEITSERDKTWDKLDFYAKVEVRELLIVERDPWELVLLRLQNGKMTEITRGNLAADTVIHSAFVPFGFRLMMRNQRPTIEVRHQTDGRVWYAQGTPAAK